MPQFKTEVPHDLTQDEAFSRLRRFGDQMRESYSSQLTELEETWHEDGRFEFSFRVMGLAISGNMVTLQEAVVVAGSIPFAALPFRGQLENEIRSQLIQALGADD